MNKSESIVKLSAALIKAQRNIGSATKGSKNPFFKSNYADLGAVMEACKDALNAEGISILQPIGFDELGDYVETLFVHESGEFISSRMRLLQGKNMQEMGSATTYARRFSLQSMGFIPAEDLDGEDLMQRNKSAAVATSLSPKTEKVLDNSMKNVAAGKAGAPIATVVEKKTEEAPTKATFAKPAAKAETAPKSAAAKELDWN